MLMDGVIRLLSIVRGRARSLRGHASLGGRRARNSPDQARKPHSYRESPESFHHA